ncbi:hypothetical protein NDU88_002926 [Pleurodeles waltl]|uniref:Uncharacterized protein n=1 Tax=Pleurodeles waltl TaxID=8319 RepID=A0AAV7SEL7_PLEWA|nr:hypothetical protein NDU88_002926 [Pleurodeles waltl]
MNTFVPSTRHKLETEIAPEVVQTEMNEYMSELTKVAKFFFKQVTRAAKKRANRDDLWEAVPASLTVANSRRVLLGSRGLSEKEEDISRWRTPGGFFLVPVGSRRKKRIFLGGCGELENGSMFHDLKGDIVLRGQNIMNV